MHPILRRALMKYAGDYFTMTQDEKDRFVLSMPSELYDQLTSYISRKLFNKSIDDDFTEAEQLEYNTVIMPIRGIGKDYFMLNESDWDEDILKRKNLYEYNEAYHNWQEEAFSNDENFPGYEKKPLYNRLHHWARVMKEGEFKYLNIDSLETWLYWKLEDAFDEFLEKEIPHELKEGKKHGSKTKGGYLFDMYYDANGLEGWLDEMKKRKFTLLSEKYERFSSLYARDYVYIEDASRDEFDPALCYIIGSLEVMKHITFQNFIDDCYPLVGSIKELHQIRDDEIALFLKELEVVLEDVKTNFSPNVIELDTNKMNVILSDGAVDDLL